MEIIMPIKDSYEVQLKEKTYFLRENDILLIPPFDYHSIRVPRKSEKGQRIIILFEPVILFNFHELSNAVNKLSNINLITPEKLPEIHEAAKNLILDCRKENKKRDIFNNVIVYTKIIELVVLLIRHQNVSNFNNLEDKLLRKRQDYIAKLDRVLEYINKNISRNITLDNAARAANLSKFHFERLFKAYMGMTFSAFLKQKRISFSEKMLLDPNLAIVDVALNSGFSSISAFNRVFKEIKKCTPSEFRKLFYHSPMISDEKPINNKKSKK